MLRFGKTIIGLVLIGSLALALSYCSSKSSDSSSGAASASLGASATSNAIQGATMGMGLSATAGSSTEAPSLRKAKSLSEAVSGLYSGLRAKRADARALKAKFMSAAAPYSAATMTAINCTSGTKTMAIVTPDILSEVTNTTMTITYANCTEYYNSNAISQLQNGTLVFVENDLSFTISLGTTTSPYTYRVTRTSDNVVLQDSVTTVTLTGIADPDSIISCGTGTVKSTEYQKVTIDMDGNLRFKGIDSDSVVYDEKVVISAFKLAVDGTLDPDTCEATGGTIAESGGFSYTDNLDSTRTSSMNVPASNPLNLIWTGGPTGDTYSISGTVRMVASCFTGSLTLATTTDIFIPTDADCPIAGEVLVSGNVNGSVVHTSTGGVQIKDNTGTVVETYASCHKAQACQL